MTSELERPGGPPPPAVLTVAAVARRLGVAPSTLRTWDRRYGLGPSAHTAGSHRRYSPGDVSRLIVMRSLVIQGVPPVEAAQIALNTPVDGRRPAGREPSGSPGADPESPGGPGRSSAWTPSLPGRRTGPSAGAPGRAFWGVPSSFGSAPVPASRGPLPGELAAPAAGALDPTVGPATGGTAAGPSPGSFGRAVWPSSPLAARHLLAAVEGLVAAPAGSPGVTDEAGDVARPTGRVGGGRIISLPDASPRARGLARAAMSLDTHELGHLLRDAVASYGVIGVWNTMVLPVLKGLGDRWEATGDGVDVEHAFVEAVIGVLRGITATLYRPGNLRPVLLACAEGDHHSLPLHVLAAALAEVGIGCRMLGAGLPTPSLAAAIRRTGPAVVVVYARLPVVNASSVREFPRQRPAPRVLIGGPGWDGLDVPPHVGRVDSLQAAVDEVRAAVHPM